MRYEITDRVLQLALAMQGSRIGLSLTNIESDFGVSRSTAQRMRDAAREEVERALASIAKTYARVLESKWLPGPRIERVAFAATKADYVPSVQQPALKLKLQNMATDPAAPPEEERCI